VRSLRPGPRGGIIKGGAVDNRLLTLSDSRGVPKMDQVKEGEVNHKLTEPFFCLLADDSLIASWSVRSAPLLSPLPAKANGSYVRLLLDGCVNVTQVNTENLGVMRN
jgi:hypothetical protein